MPKGPARAKAPSGCDRLYITVAKIATGEIEEEEENLSGRIHSGKAGGKARAEKLTKQQRSRIARKAAEARRGQKTI